MTRWDGIEEFVAVETAGSFAGGAHALGLSTSHISRSIARLENRIQAQLFFRTTRKVTLTDTGRALIEQFRRIVQERDEALASISDEGKPQGELRFTCSTALGERFVAPIVRKFAAENPDLRVTIELTNRLVDLVAEGFDLAVRTGNLTDSRLIGTRIASRRLYLCGSPAYLGMHGRPRTVEELSSHQCLVGTASTWQFRVDGTGHIFRPKGRWRCNSGATVVDAALADMGLCQLPELYVLPHIMEGRLEAVLDEFRANDEPIWAVYPQRRHLLPKVRKLVDRLRAELGPVLDPSSSEPPADAASEKARGPKR